MNIPLSKMTKSSTRTCCMSIQESVRTRHFLDAEFVEVYRDGEFLCVTTKALASFMDGDGDYQYRAVDLQVDKAYDGFAGTDQCDCCGDFRVLYSATFDHPEDFDDINLVACQDCHDDNTNEMIEHERARLEEDAIDYYVDRAHSIAQGMER